MPRARARHLPRLRRHLHPLRRSEPDKMKEKALPLQCEHDAAYTPDQSIRMILTNVVCALCDLLAAYPFFLFANVVRLPTSSGLSPALRTNKRACEPISRSLYPDTPRSP